jgi:hypothetical protein
MSVGGRRIAFPQLRWGGPDCIFVFLFLRVEILSIDVALALLMSTQVLAQFLKIK